MSTRQNGNQTRGLEYYRDIISGLTEGSTVTLKRGRKMKVHKKGVDKDLLAVWLVNEDGTLPTLNNGTQGPELYDLDAIGGVFGFTTYNGLFKGAIFNKNSKRYKNGAIVTLKGNNKLKGRKMMVHPRGYDKDLNAVWLVNEDGTLPTLNNGTKGPELYDLDAIYAVNDRTIGNARKYNDIQGVLSSHLSRVNEHAIFNTKEGVLQFLNQNSLRSLSQVDSGFRNMVKHSYHFQPLVLKQGQKLADLYRSFPGALNIDLSKRPDIQDEELLEAMPLGFKNVRVLKMDSCFKITDVGLARLTNLTRLNMDFCFQITNAGLAPLTNLTSLNMRDCETITDEGLQNLTNLTSLNMENCDQITNIGLAPLTNLTSLDMALCERITDAGLAPLTNLTNLNMAFCRQITNAGLAPLTNLTSLNMAGCIQITNVGLAPLTNLTSLNMLGCRQITPAAFTNLNKLEYCNAIGTSQDVEEAAKAKIAENKARKKVSTMEALNGGTRRRRSKKSKKSKKIRRN